MSVRLRRALASAAAGALLASGTASASAPATTDLARLERLVTAFGTELGTPVDGSAVRRAGLSPAVAGALATTLDALLACHRTSHSGLTDTALATALEGCGHTLVAAVDALRPVLYAAPSTGGLDLWPVLRYEPGNEDNTYLHDYALQVDAAGSDEYFNNSGGNAIDVLRSPSNSPAARGCETDGELGMECVVAAAALVDLSGSDTYGRFQAPNRDAVCTADDVVRRIVLHGAGAAGAGVLVDDRGDDTYNGKVLTVGLGHFGFGYLRDGEGDDAYTAVRVSIGSGIVAGVGEHIDLGGNDTYGYYLPAPLDPNAPNLTPGAGGVLDNEGACDRTAHTLIGAGLLGAAGRLRNSGGDDTYTGPVVGSIGSGRLGGAGVFVDEGGGDDTYAGPPGRADDVTLLPSTDDQGIFTDR